MRLRDYQRNFRASILSEFKECDSVLLPLFTGGGKTILFASIIRCFANPPPGAWYGGRAMVLAHRRELIFQARDKIEAAAGVSVEIEMGEDFRANENCQDMFGRGRAQAIVSTIQTQITGGDGGGRKSKFNPDDFGLLIIDEAHHAVSQSYQKAIQYYRQNPKLKVLGVTATPKRADEEALGQVFESALQPYWAKAGIADGWLVPIDAQSVHISDLDLSGVRTTSAGDLNGSDLEAVFASEKLLLQYLQPTFEILHGLEPLALSNLDPATEWAKAVAHIRTKQALGFTASVYHAEKFCEILNRVRPGMAAWVCGETDKDERRRINADFDSRKINVLLNYGTHTEGYDSPNIEVLLMARPTENLSLFEQMLGRGFRPLPGVVDGPETALARREAIANSAKPVCLCVDFVGNSGKHKLCTTFDVLGGIVSERVIEQAIEICRKSGKPMRVDETIEEEELADAEREKRRLEEEARRSRLVAKVKYANKSVDLFDVLQIKPTAPRGWDNNKQLSEKQRNFLRKAGLNPDALPYAQAKQLIGAMLERFYKNLCTLKQAALLKKHGYPADMTFDQAKVTIDALAKNGWKRPPEPDLNYPPEVAAVDNCPF